MKTITIIILMFASINLMGQSGTVTALQYLQQTDFLKQYEELKNRAESSVRNFKLVQNRYSDDEVQGVIAAYNSSAEYFNAALFNIKQDMLNKNKRKYLVTYPDAYSKQIEADLYRAKEYYANTFQREITQVTDGEITGVALLALLPEVIKYAQFAIQAIKEIRNKLKEMNEQVLDQYLIEPYKFKPWDEIA